MIRSITRIAPQTTYLSRRSLSAAVSDFSAYKAIQVEQPSEHVLHVQLARPKAMNALPISGWHEIRDIFNKISRDGTTRAIVLSGQGKMFCSGIDVSSLIEMGSIEAVDASRKARKLRFLIQDLQECVYSIHACEKPVIACIHNGCIGGGVDIASACDIRYASQDAWFQIKEVLVGLAADIGSLQFLPKVVGNQALLKELVYTGRKFDATEAKSELGLVAKVFSSQEECLKSGLELAKTIASLSPIAIHSSKINLNYSIDNSVEDGLKYIASWNASMLQSEDTVKAVMAVAAKEPQPKFEDI